MCIGVPMQIIEILPSCARARSRSGEHIVDTALVAGIEPGSWVMVFLDAAREIISEEAAEQSANALEALEMAMQGKSGFDHLFADLVGREPQLPDHLKPAPEENT
ncbi:HypC/HybG/HupF family hydrogenase formation chaperone [Hoeflea sp. TYP-13]|uniref:HypC/HybG/HupF family hydrogenase formation chaperone n=1 Tax=Hoeflea sp. TYP-13 TaxID=3230023 RepID=UPI0034C63805